MKLTTLALTALALTLTSSDSIAGPSTGKADAKSGIGASVQMRGSLAQGEEATLDFLASPGRVRLEVLVERGMSVGIVDLKTARKKHGAISSSAKPQVIEFDVAEPTRLQIRIKPLKLRRPSGPFLHMPARAERESGYSLSIANAKNGVKGAAAVRGDVGSLSGQTANAGQPSSSRGSGLGQIGNPKAGMKNSAEGLN